MSWPGHIRFQIGAYDININPNLHDHRDSTIPQAPIKITLPRTEEGTPIPLVFGRCRVDSPILAWTSDLQHKASDNSNNGPSYLVYGLDMYFVVGIPMGTNITSAQYGPLLHNVWMGDQVLPPPEAGSLPGVGLQLYKAQGVHRPKWLGGPGNGGGIVGMYRFFQGTTGQSITSPATSIGNRMTTLGDVTLIPGYRRMMGVAFTRYPGSSDPEYGFTGSDAADATPTIVPTYGFMLGESANVDGFSFEVSAYGDVVSGVSGHIFSMVNQGLDFGGDADPIEVIYDIMTSKWSKLGIDPSKIDLASFAAASATLKAENHGYSRVHYEHQSGAQVIVEILAQIDAALYQDPATSLITIKLIRADYDPASLQLFTTDNIISVDSYAIGTFKDTVNEVRARYTDRTAAYKPGVAIAQSLANAVGNSNRRRSKTIEYPGITNAALAASVAARDLNVLSQPLSKIVLTVNRDGHRMRPGVAFKVTWPEYGLNNAIFRAQRVDPGQLFDNKIVINAVQDAFASTYIGLQLDWGLTVAPAPAPFVAPIVTEAPRWLAMEAQNSGLVVDPDIPRLFPLPVASSNAIGFAMDSLVTLWHPWDDTIFSRWLSDVPLSPFPPTFTLVSNYGRELEPYDTTTGVVVANLANEDDATFVSRVATHNDIALSGRNLAILITALGFQEIIAFESVTSLGGSPTQYRLNNVWRGLLDTPPVAHLAGERGFAITPSMIGRRGWNPSKVVETLLYPRSALQLGSGEDPAIVYKPPQTNIQVLQFDSAQPYAIQTGMAGRSLLPYPIARMRIVGEGCTGTLGLPSVAGRYNTVTVLEEGVDLYGDIRDRRNTTILRGDDGPDPTGSSEWKTIHATQRNLPIAALTGNRSDPTIISPINCYVDSLGTTGAASTNSPGGSSPWFVLNRIDGIGNLDVSVLSTDALSGIGGNPSTDLRVGKAGLSDGATLNEWQSPRVPVWAPHWRNLLANVRWNYQAGGAIQQWTANAVASGNFSLQRAASGAGSYYADATGGMAQYAPISAWAPRGYTVVAIGYAKNANSDTNDTGRIDLGFYVSTSTLPANGPTKNPGALISSSSSSTFVPPTANWQRRSFFVAAPATTEFVLMTLTSSEVAAGGGSAGADTRWSEVELRIGQLLLDLLTNNSFDANLASWTIDSGSPNQLNTIASPSAGYCNGPLGTSYSLHQDVAIPTGWEYGSTALLTAFVAQRVANNPGKITLQSLDGGSNVLASGTTSDYTLAALDNWYKKTVYTDVPDGSATIRTKLDATYVSGASNGNCFDECILWLFKDVAPRYQKIFDFSAPTVQQTPNSWQSYVLSYPTNPIPDYVFHGDSNGQEVTWTDGTARSAQLVGQFGNGVTSTDAYPFARASGASAVHVAATGQGRTAIANFKLTDPFTVGVWFRVDEPGFASLCGLAGRMDLTAGWGINISAAGQLTALLRGAGATSKSVSTGRVCSEGGFRQAYLVNDPVAQLLWIYDETGGVSVSTASGLGAIDRVASTCHFRIGRDADDHDVLPGQVGRVFIWKVALTSAQIAAHHNYARDPSGLITTYTRTAVALAFGHNDASGNATAYHMAPGQIAMPYHATLAVDGGTGYGLAVGKSTTNLLKDALFTGANWTLAGGATRTTGVTDITGLPRAAQIVGDASNGIKAINVTLAASPANVVVVFAAMASTGTPTLNINLRNSSGTLKNTQTVTLSTAMQRFAVTLAAWDGSTATAQIEFISAAGALTLTLSAVMCISQGTDIPALLPLPNATHGDYSAVANITLPIQFNSEGELIAEGVGMIDSPTPATGMLVYAKANANNNNRREVKIVSSGTGFRCTHYDSAAASTDATKAYSTYSSKVWKARARWCRIQLLDNTGTTPFTTVGYTDNSQPVVQLQQGRTAIFTMNTTQCDRVGIGDLSPPSDVVLRKVTVQCREEKLP